MIANQLVKSEKYIKVCEKGPFYCIQSLDDVCPCILHSIVV